MQKKENTEWTLIRSEDGPDLDLFKVRFDYKVNPRNGKTVKVVVLDSTDSVNVVALTTEKKILFVRQHRFGTGEVTLELPGGLVEPGEDHKIACKRELSEETGYRAENYIYLGNVSSNPVFMNSLIHHWFADQSQLAGPQSLDDAEDGRVVLLDMEEARQKLFSGDFRHPHTISALLRFYVHLENGNIFPKIV